MSKDNERYVELGEARQRTDVCASVEENLCASSLFLLSQQRGLLSIDPSAFTATAKEQLC